MEDINIIILHFNNCS